MVGSFNSSAVFLMSGMISFFTISSRMPNAPCAMTGTGKHRKTFTFGFALLKASTSDFVEAAKLSFDKRGDAGQPGRRKSSPVRPPVAARELRYVRPTQKKKMICRKCEFKFLADSDACPNCRCSRPYSIAECGASLMAVLL